MESRWRKSNHIPRWPAAFVRHDTTQDSVRFGLGAARGWRYSLLLHPVGLGAQDEAEEVLIGDCGAPGRRRRGHTSLVIQPGTLALDEHVEEVIPLGGLSRGVEATAGGGCVGRIGVGDGGLGVGLLWLGGGECGRRG